MFSFECLNSMVSIRHFTFNDFTFNFFSFLVSDKSVLIPPADNSPDAPGEMGRPVVLPTNITAELKKQVDDGWLKNAFNQYASDLISVHRSLPDPRDSW